MINLAWDHNSFYQERLLRALPDRCQRVLDVGCGAGAFAARLAERADQVDAIDRSRAMIALAERATPANVSCLVRDAATADLPAAAYDAITSISALHQMDLPVVLPRLGAALRPGGLLIAVALHRLEIPRGLPAELVSVFASAGLRLRQQRAPGRAARPAGRAAVPAGDVPAAGEGIGHAGHGPGGLPQGGARPGGAGAAGVAGAVAGALALRAHLAQAPSLSRFDPTRGPREQTTGQAACRSRQVTHSRSADRS